MTEPMLRGLRDQLVDGAVRHRRRRRRVTAAASVVLLALGGAGVYVAATGGSGDDVVATRDRDPTDTADDTSTSSSSTTTDTTTSDLPGLSSAEAEQAESVVRRFLADIRRGDLEAAARQWTGYPDAWPGRRPGERVPFIEALLDDSEFARILEPGADVYVTPSWSWTDASPVVTVAAGRAADRPPAAVSFLVGRPGELAGEPGDPGTLRIQRIPSPRSSDGADPPPGAYVEAGQRIVVPGIPMEGGARVHVNGFEVPVDIDLPRRSLAFSIPDTAAGDIAVTLTVATPELAGVQAFAYTAPAG